MNPYERRAAERHRVRMMEMHLLAQRAEAAPIGPQTAAYADARAEREWRHRKWPTWAQRASAFASEPGLFVRRLIHRVIMRRRSKVAAGELSRAGGTL